MYYYDNFFIITETTKLQKISDFLRKMQLKKVINTETKYNKINTILQSQDQQTVRYKTAAHCWLKLHVHQAALHKLFQH